MIALYQGGAAVLGVLGALEGIRAVALIRHRDPDASSCLAAAALLLSLGLIFLVMARVDG